MWQARFAVRHAKLHPADCRCHQPSCVFMISLCGCSQVGTEHVLLGLVAEDNLSKHGYLNSGLTLEAARTGVEANFGKKRSLTTNDAIPFSREVRKNFELATSVSQRDCVCPWVLAWQAQVLTHFRHAGILSCQHWTEQALSTCVLRSASALASIGYHLSTSC